MNRMIADSKMKRSDVASFRNKRKSKKKLLNPKMKVRSKNDKDDGDSDVKNE